MPDTALIIGRYRVMRTLGRGGMGVVYQAHDDVIDRQVALKIVHADLLGGQEREDFIERFQQEARAAGRCNHPAIVAIYDFALHEGNPFLAMEFVDGVGLDRAIAEAGDQHFAPATAVHIALELLGALGNAHAAGIVHRDIKPANILLVDGGRLKVTDFGVARIENAGITAHGQAIGTPRYMSTEQWKGQPVDARSDLFSVGVLLQEMLIGEHPFTGANANEIAYKLANSEPRGGQALIECAGHAVKDVIHCALQKNPGARFASAEDMADALRKAAASPSDAATAVTATADLEKTMIAVRTRTAQRRAALPSFDATLDPSVISGIERQLALHVGPIARFLVQSSLKNAPPSVEALCDDLARRIDRPTDRSQFLTSAMQTVHSISTSGSNNTGHTGRRSAAHTPVSQPSLAPSGPISAEEIERIRQALAKSQGPIAKILIKRALPNAGDAYELWDLLAKEIQSEADRALFLKQREAQA